LPFKDRWPAEQKSASYERADPAANDAVCAKHSVERGAKRYDCSFTSI